VRSSRRPAISAIISSLMKPNSSCAYINIGISALRLTGYAFCSRSNRAVSCGEICIVIFVYIPVLIISALLRFSVCRFTRLRLADLSIDVPENNIDGSDAGNHIRQQLPFDNPGQRLQIHERRRAEMAAQRLRRPIAGNVTAEFPTRRFDGNVCISRRWRKALGENLEMVDESFHFSLHLFAFGRNDARSLGTNGALISDFRHGLFDDFETLANLGNADHVPAIAIGIGARRNIEIEFFVAGIRKKLAIVVSQACRAQRWSAHAVSDGVFKFDYADVLQARQPDAVLGEQRFVFIDTAGHHFQKAADNAAPACGWFEGPPADADVAGHHALAGETFKNFKDLFTLAEAIKKDGHGAHVDSVRA